MIVPENHALLPKAYELLVFSSPVARALTSMPVYGMPESQRLLGFIMYLQRLNTIRAGEIDFHSCWPSGVIRLNTTSIPRRSAPFLTARDAALVTKTPQRAT